jgi:hypothetical protein
MLSLICENLTSQTHSSVCRVEWWLPAVGGWG